MNLKSIHLNAVQDGIKNAIFLRADDKKEYIDKKPTGNMEATYVEVLISGLGNCQLIFPYRNGLAEMLSEQIQFGQVFNALDICNLEDIKVSMYKESLTIKFLVTEKTISRKD